MSGELDAGAAPPAAEGLLDKWDAAACAGLSEAELLLYRSNLLGSDLRITNFGRTSLVDWLDTRDVYKAKATTDVSAGYRVSNDARISIGAANVFNVYPTQQDTETETGGTWDAVQMGFSGAFYFARLSVRL